VQKKRRFQKKTREFGKGNGANTPSNRSSSALRRHIRNTPKYVPTTYRVKLGDDNSEFQHLFNNNPAGSASLVHDDLFKAINKHRNLSETNNYPTAILNAWNYEFRTPYVIVPQKLIQTNNYTTGEITLTPVESPYRRRR